MIDNRGLDVKIEIDGGVTTDNAAEILASGADVLVAGNTVFSSPDPAATISQLKNA
jgi:ribulose-phosphate 3-epimerase